jgi:hypothetical protein
VLKDFLTVKYSATSYESSYWREALQLFSMYKSVCLFR